MKFLVTGAAGFIGFHLSLALIDRGDQVVGVDNLNHYYDPALKLERLSVLAAHSNASCFEFLKLDIADRYAMEDLFSSYKFDIVVNLAAQAGVRYSLQNPHAYVDSNIVGFLNILEGCRTTKVKHLVYASSSSVYGMNIKQPFSTNDRTDCPVSLYAATKKSNELMAHTYSHLFALPTTGLRFFTVYGPYGRPDMAYYKFTKAILEGNVIDVYNDGKMRRDFTFIEDVVEGLLRVIARHPCISEGENSEVSAPHKIYNIGNNKPVSLLDFLDVIEQACGRKAVKRFLPMQPGDVYETYADIDDLSADTGFVASVSIEVGLRKFVEWYLARA